MSVNSPARRPLHILMIAPTSFFSDYGGHIRILEETRALQSLGHQVTIVTYYKGSDMPGLDIRRTPPLPWRTDYEVGSSRHKLAFDVFLAAKSLREGLRVKPDIIHGHMHEGALIGGVLAKMLGVPMIFDFQGSLTAEMVDHKFLTPGSKVFRGLHRVERFISRRLPEAILTSSIQARQILEDEFNVRPEKIYPLPDCADTERFHPGILNPGDSMALRQQLKIPDKEAIIIYLGLLTDYQGIPYLIDTAARLKQQGEAAHFLIMGYPNVEHYQQLANEARVTDKVTFTGKIEYRDAPRYLSLGDIAVAPKVSATEGSGKLLNYMALELPVVAFDTPVHREYLDDLGVYAPIGDVPAFSSALCDLLRDRPRREELGKQLRERAETHYSWRRAGNEIQEVYYRLTT